MSIQLKVPSIACEVCAKTITTAIKNQQPAAEVSVDVANKIVTVDTDAPEALIKEVIEAAGHTVET